MNLPEDLTNYLLFSQDEFFEEEEVVRVHASVAGEPGGREWFWVLELKENVFVLTQAFCGMYGWSSTCGGQSFIAPGPSAIEAALLAPEEVVYDLLSQLR